MGHQFLRHAFGRVGATLNYVISLTAVVFVIFGAGPARAGSFGPRRLIAGVNERSRVEMMTLDMIRLLGRADRLALIDRRFLANFYLGRSRALRTSVAERVLLSLLAEVRERMDHAPETVDANLIEWTSDLIALSTKRDELARDAKQYLTLLDSRWRYEIRARAFAAYGLSRRLQDGQLRERLKREVPGANAKCDGKLVDLTGIEPAT